MEQKQLIEQYLRLKRKLANSYQAWHSGRIDRLAAALRTVEQQLQATPAAPRGAEFWLPLGTA